MNDKRKDVIDKLFIQCADEYYDPQKLEFYECVKIDEIIKLLLQDEKFTLEYLSTATKEFFNLIFCEINDTAERILQKFPSKKMSLRIKCLCDTYKDERNAQCVSNILKYLELLNL